MKIKFNWKSPGVLSGAGITGTSGAGVGGWQIYEASDPTLHRDLTGMGFTYSPINAPKESDPTESKFTHWHNGGCVDKLFPNSGITHEMKNSNTTSSNVVDTPGSLTTDNFQAGNNFIICAMMQLKSVTLNEKFPNRIYFKSEVAVKGENYGGILGTGLSALPQKGNDHTNTYSESLNFLHKLLVLEKEGESGKVKNGYGGLDYGGSENQSDAKFVITTPLGSGMSEDNPGSVKNGGKTKEPERKLAGIAEISNNEKDPTLIKSMAVYEKASKPEFGGTDGTFPAQTTNTPVGYSTAVLKYEVGENKGTTPTLTQDLSSYLRGVYSPFKDKKVSGSDLESGCNGWSKKRSRHISPSEKSNFQSLCYQKPTTSQK